jgi:hypothetical protein
MDRKAFILAVQKRLPPPGKSKGFTPETDDEDEDDGTAQESALESFFTKGESGDYSGAHKAFRQYVGLCFPDLATDDEDEE